MKNVFSFGALLVLALIAAGAYLYLNPQQAPVFLRDLLPGLDLPSPTSPMKEFRPPQW